MKQPERLNSLQLLVPYVRDRVEDVIERLQARGLDPVVIETLRTKERQRWLWGQGRSKWACIKAGISPAFSHPGNIVTKTLKSRHIVGKAVDCCSRSHGYSNATFFDALREEARKVGLDCPFDWDRAHCEWR